MNKTIITILIMFSCSVAWGHDIQVDGKLHDCLMTDSDYELHFHPDPLRPELYQGVKGMKFLFPKPPGHRHEWYDKAYDFPNSFQGKVIGRLCKIEGCKAEYDWTPKSRITIEKLQKQIELIKLELEHLKDLMMIVHGNESVSTSPGHYKHFSTLMREHNEIIPNSK